MNLINTLISNRGMEDSVTIIVTKVDELEILQPSELAMLAWQLIKMADDEDEFGFYEAELDHMVNLMASPMELLDRVLPYTRQRG